MKKILIVDDELIFRREIRYLFDWEAYHYTIAGEAVNGKEALELTERISPDIIICDIVMPVLNGVEFVKIASKMFPSVKFIMLSNYDEYSHVRQAFRYGASDYLLKSQLIKADLLACLDKLCVNDEDITENPTLLLGALTKQYLDGFAPEPFLKFDRLLAHQMPEKFFQMFHLDISSMPDDAGSDITTLCETTLIKYNCLSVLTRGSVCVLLINGAQPLTEQATADLFQELCRKYSDCFGIISKPFYRTDNLKIVYDRLTVLSGYSIFSEKSVFVFEESLIRESQSPPFNHELYRSYIIKCDFSAAHTFIFSYVEHIRESFLMDPYEFKKWIENTMYNTIAEIKANLCDDPRLDNIKLRLFKGIDTARSFPDVRELLQSVYQEMEQVCGASQIHTDQLVPRMIAFISQNYQKPITLYDVANYLHVNYSYLSSYIGANSEMHFSEHLNEIRIANAKKLLAASERSISSISEDVGYTDQSYFGKVFKKITGETPLEYRKKYQTRGDRHA